MRRATTGCSVDTRSRSSRVGYLDSVHFASSQSMPITHCPGAVCAATFRNRSSASSMECVPLRRVHPSSPALSARWAWASMNPGTTTRPWKSIRRVRRSAHRSASTSVPTATMRSSRIAIALAQGRTRAAVKIFPPTNTRSAPRAMVTARPAIPGGGQSPPSTSRPVSRT